MDNTKWSNVLIEWVNCLKLCKNIANLDELRNGEFFSNVQKVIIKSREAQVDVLTFIFDLIGTHYPSYNIDNQTEIHLFDLSENDLKAVTSLLMHFTCIYDRRDVLTSPLCHSLSQSTQLIIRNFLQKITKNVTKEIMNDIIQSCIDDASDHVTNQWLCVENTTKNSPLQDLLKTPISKFGRLQEKDRIISQLKSELEAERYEKADLQEELKTQLEKNKKTELQLSQKSSEISRLRAEVLALENRTPPHFQDMDSRDLQRRLRSEIQSLEMYIKQIENEQEEIRKEKDAAKEQLRKVEAQSTIWEEKFFDTERSFESLTEHSKKQEEELKELKDHCGELTALLEEYRSKSNNDSSLYDTFVSVDGKNLNETPPCEDLACSVIEVQLRDAQKQNEELRMKIGQSEEVVAELRASIVEFEARVKKSEEDREELIHKIKSLETEKGGVEKELGVQEENLAEARKKSKKLEEEREDLAIKLREKDENLLKVEDLKKELLGKVDSLRKYLNIVETQLSEAVNDKKEQKKKCQGLENELHDVKLVSEKLQFELAEAVLENQRVNTALSVLNEEKEKILQKLFEFQTYSENLRNDIDGLRTENYTINEDLVQKIAQLEKIEEERSELKNKLQAADGKITNLEESNKKINAEKSQLEEQLTKTLKDLELSQKASKDLKEAQQTFEGEISKMAKSYDKLQEELNEVRRVEQRIRQELEQNIAEVSLLKEEKKNLTLNLRELEDSRDDLIEKNEEWQRRYEIVQNKLTTAIDFAEIGKSKCVKLQESKSALENQLKQVQASLEKSQKEAEEMKIENRKINDILVETEKKFHDSEEKRSLFENQNEELKTRVHFLQKQLSEEENKLKLSRDEVEKVKKELRFEIGEVELEKQKLSKDLSETKESLLKLEEETIILTTKVEVSEENCRNLEAKLRGEIEDLQKRLTEVLESSEKEADEFSKTQRKLEETKTEKEDLERVISELKMQNRNLEKDLLETRSMTTELERERAQLIGSLENLSENNELLRGEVGDLENQLIEALSELNKLKEIKNTIQTDLQDAERISQNLKVELETIYLQLVESQNKYENLESEKRAFEKEVIALRSAQEFSEENVETLRSHIEQIQRENLNLKDKLERIEDDITIMAQEKGVLFHKKRDLESKNGELRHQMEILQRQLLQDRNRYAEIKYVNDSLENKLEELEEKSGEVLFNVKAENEILISKVQGIESKCEVLEVSLAESNEKLRIVVAEKHRLEEALADLEKVRKILTQSEDNRKKLEEEKDLLTKKIMDLERLNEDLAKRVTEMESAEKEHTEKLCKEKVEILSQSNILKDQLAILERDYKQLKNDKEIVEKQLNEVSILSETLKEESEKMRLQYQESQIELEEIRASFSKLASKNEDLVSTLQDMTQKNKDFENNFEVKQNALVKLENENESLASENQSLKKRVLEIETAWKVVEDSQKTELETVLKQVGETIKSLEDSQNKVEELTQKIEQLGEEKLMLEKKVEVEEIVTSETREKVKLLEETVQDYEITISGLKSVVDTNFETLEGVKEELKERKNKEEETIQVICNLLEDSDIAYEKQEDFKTFISNIFGKLLEAKKEVEKHGKELKNEIEELKAKNVAATNLNGTFQQMVEKLHVLVLEQNDVNADTLKSNFDQIHTKVNNVLQLKQKLSHDLDRLKVENLELSKAVETVTSEKEEILKSKVELENNLAEEKEKVANLRKELESKPKPIKQEKENILSVSTKSNKSREEDLKKDNMMLKRKLVLTENAKNNLEKVVKELREEKKKVQSPSSPANDFLYKKLLQEYIQVKEENEQVVKEKDAKIEELCRINDELKIKSVPIKIEDEKKLNQDLQNIREAYGNVMSINSKLEMEIVSLRKVIEERNLEMSNLAHIKEAYEKLLEENNKVMTEVDTVKYKRMRDKEEFIRLLKKERDEFSNRELKKIQEIRSEYEGKLEKMKDKMLKLYREEVNKKVRSLKDGQSETANFMKTIAILRSELFEADQKIQLLEMEKEMLKSNRKLPTETRTVRTQSVTSITRHEERAATLPRSSISEEITVSRRTPTGGIPTGISAPSLPMEDEEDLFNDKYLTDLKEGKCPLPADRESNASRFSELAWRNSMVPPHLKSSYPAELQFVSPTRFKDEDIKAGHIEFEDSLCKLLPGEKPRKKDFGTTSYKKPGPPTPSKNGGRLSLQGNEVHPMREGEGKTPKRSTPSRIKALFTGRNSSTREGLDSQNNASPSRGRRLSFFRRPR